MAIPVVYATLGAAVLRMAYADATRVRACRPGGWPLALEMRRDALEFFFSPDPEITAIRCFWGTQANLHPDQMRRGVEDAIMDLMAGASRVSRTGVVRRVEGSSHGAVARPKDRPRLPSGS